MALFRRQREPHTRVPSYSGSVCIGCVSGRNLFLFGCLCKCRRSVRRGAGDSDGSRRPRRRLRWCGATDSRSLFHFFVDARNCLRGARIISGVVLINGHCCMGIVPRLRRSECVDARARVDGAWGGGRRFFWRRCREFVCCPPHGCAASRVVRWVVVWVGLWTRGERSALVARRHGGRDRLRRS